MKKILVAGAGHGGLVAAYHLALKGFDVTVYEKKARETLGFDWHDSINWGAFDDSDIPRPDKSLIRGAVHSGFENPSSTVKLYLSFEGDRNFLMDRKLLINYLVEIAEKAGVKFCFGCEIEGAVLDGLKVAGVKVIKDGEKSEVKADLVIDACGNRSPVRKSLPPCFGIKNNLYGKDVFYVYRAYFENLTGEKTDPEYLIGLFRQGKPGIDWILTDEDSVDILVGKFGSAGELTDEEIEASVSDYRSRFPFMGEKIIRGGSKEVIPLSRMLPLLVAQGYALIGDSACMTVPLTGSGIVLSMNAGKILAEKIIGCDGDPCSVENLWQYQYEYFQKYGKDLVMIDILKNFFTRCSKKDVDYFLEKRILTEDHLDFNGSIDVTPAYILHVLSVSLPLVRLLSPLVSNLKSIPFIEAVAKAMPKEYDKKAVEDWIVKYEKL